MIKWSKATEEERALARVIADRAHDINPKVDRIHVEMDILATHVSGCKLDLKKLAEFDDLNFVHDVGGINRHLDHETGKLQNCFLPRCAV